MDKSNQGNNSIGLVKFIVYAITKILAIVIIAIVVTSAIREHINGVVLASGIGVIAGLGGYGIGKHGAEMLEYLKKSRSKNG